ncbi:unnamed protein product [Effrenium voratum]|nr:unnamed protein product [Effrenium voratum]
MAGGYPAGSAPAPLVEDLQKKREELRKELLKIEAQIVEEEALLRQNALHHRPSYSLLKGESEDAAPSTMVRQVSPQDFDAVLRDFPSLVIEPIGSFNHWDRRECAVANPEEWKAVCSKYQQEVLKGKAQIPKVIHQIWIGPKEPPCLWIDTFRVEYLASHPGWGFHLWSDDEVARLPMINEEIYNKERMWQCKADILRLEFLWHHGGMYVDADMISVEQKSLDKILHLGNETGWVIAYEPDTKVNAPCTTDMYGKPPGIPIDGTLALNGIAGVLVLICPALPVCLAFIVGIFWNPWHLLQSAHLQSAGRVPHFIHQLKTAEG